MGAWVERSRRSSRLGRRGIVRLPFRLVPAWAFLLLLPACAAAEEPAPGQVPSPPDIAARTNAALRFLYTEMDRWTDGTVIYDERASGGAGYYPTNWMGDIDDLVLEEGSTESPASGTTCLKLTYTPRGQKGYVGIYWTYPDVPGGNWGDKPGRDLTGATRLRGRIRGGHGGESVELRIGGINCPPHFDPAKPQRDRFGPIPQDARTTLSDKWQDFEIRIPRGTPLHGVLGGFAIVLDRAHNGGGRTEVYLDDVRYDNADKEALRLIRYYVPRADPVDDAIRNEAYVYDNDLAILALLARSDTQAERRAGFLAETIIWVQGHDRLYKDDRLRNAYSCGPIIDPATNTARMPGIYDPKAGRVSEDRYVVSADTGNMAWSAIALVSAHRRLEAGKTENYAFLRAAIRIAEWIECNCRVKDSLGGYSGGFEGWDRSKDDPQDPKQLEWRSVEHCIDAYVAFSQIADAIAAAKRANADLWGDKDAAVWRERARHALRFVFAMWDPGEGHFWVGTRDSQGTVNHDAIAADAQTWSLLALGHLPEYRRLIGWTDPESLPPPIRWVEERCRREAGGRNGYSFSAEGKGIWPEGCAHLAACYHYLHQPRRAEAILREIVAVSPAGAPGPNGEAGSLGIVAAFPELAETGFLKEFAPKVVGPWTYPRRPHLGASSWFIMAALGANPYWLDGPPRPNR